MCRLALIQGHRRSLLYPLLCLCLQSESLEECTSEPPKVIPQTMGAHIKHTHRYRHTGCCNVNEMCIWTHKRSAVRIYTFTSSNPAAVLIYLTVYVLFSNMYTLHGYNASVLRAAAH